MPPIIAFHTKYARRDWWLFAVYSVAAGVACAALGLAMERDEVRAARSRAEYVARTLAERFAVAGATPGSDVAATLAPLAAAAAPDLKFAVVELERPGPFTYVTRGRYVAHSEPLRAGRPLDAREPEDRRAIDLLARAHEAVPGTAVLLWTRGEVAAAATSPDSKVTAIVDGLRPRALSHRPRTLAFAAFLMLLLFSAGLHDILPRIGRYLNVAVLLGAVGVLALLGAALEPSLWRGVTDDLIVRRAELLRLSDLTRALVKDLPPPSSEIASWGAKLAAAACGGYVVALSRPFRRATIALGGQSTALRLAAPATGLLVLSAAVPILATVVLSLFRATPTERSFSGVENFLALAAVNPASPTSVWHVAAVNVAWVASSASLQLLAGLALTVLGSLLDAWPRRLFRTALFLPWAMPAYVSALVGAHVLQLPVLARVLPSGWMQHADGAFVASVMVSVWIGGPLLAAVGLAALEQLPAEAVEAMRAEGVGPLGRVRHLVLPCLQPVMRPALGLTALFAVNSFAVIDLVSGSGPDGATDLLVLRAYRWAFERYEFGLAAAWSVVAIGLTAGLVAALCAAARRVQPATSDSEAAGALRAAAGVS